MEIENPNSPPRPQLPVAPSAEGAMLVSLVACAFWSFLVFVQVGSELIGPGKGIFSDHAIGVRGGLAFVWLLAAIGSAVFGKQSLGVIERSEGRLGGRGEAVAAMILSLGTIALTVLALVVYGVFQLLK
jgi:hypothetical protein